ncbi:ankyrin repeat and EF-hand domain-containing protein 1-like, partial [Clarias magur]
MASGIMLRSNTMAQDPIESKQVHKLLQLVTQKKKELVEKFSMRTPGVINMTEPEEGISALHLVAMSHDMDMARFLLSLNAHPDIQDKMGRTPMMLAAELGDVRMVELLANNRANMTLVDKEGKGILFYCIQPTKMHAQILEMASNMNADVNNVSNAGKSVFMLACERAKDCEHLCIRLLEKGADPCVADAETGCTPLMAAVRAGAVELVRAILQRGANPNSVDKRQMRAAHVAASKGLFEVLRMLSSYLADFNVETSLGNTPLHAAAAEGYAECCRFLAQRGCNATTKNILNLIPSQIAKKNGHKAALKELKLAEKASTSEATISCISAAKLHDWSYQHEDELRDAFQAAVESDAPVENIPTKTFASVLQAHNAPIDNDGLNNIIEQIDVHCNEQININDFFLGKNFLPNKYQLMCYVPKTADEADTKKEDRSPLLAYTENFDDTRKISEPFTCKSRERLRSDHASNVEKPLEMYININQCVQTDDFEALSLAFKQDVPVDFRDRCYKTPLMTACKSGNYQMAQFLISHGANVNAYDQVKWTALHHACFTGNTEIVNLLLEHGAVVDAVTSNGVTPLMRAIQSCKIDSVEQLIKAGANIEATNKRGDNCVFLATKYGTGAICNLVKTSLELSQAKKPEKKGAAAAPPPAKAPEKGKDPGGKPAGKEAVTPKTKAGQKKCVIALNLLSTDHCITFPSVN